MSLRDIDNWRHLWSQTVAAVCYLNECKIDFTHPHTVHLPGQIDGDTGFGLCWRRLHWSLLHCHPMVSAAVCVCMCQSRFACTYVWTGTCVSTRVLKFVSLERNLLTAWKSWVYCCIQSTSSPEVSMATEKVKVRLEVSREFRRDTEKDFVLPHEDSFCQLNVTERISEWPQSSVPHEQSVISKHSSHNIRPLRDTPQWQFM